MIVSSARRLFPNLTIVGDEKMDCEQISRWSFQVLDSVSVIEDPDESDLSLAETEPRTSFVELCDADDKDTPHKSSTRPRSTWLLELGPATLKRKPAPASYPSSFKRRILVPQPVSVE